MNLKSCLHLMFIAFMIGCGSSQIDYSNIEKIETLHIPFGINIPIEIGEGVVDIDTNKILIIDSNTLKEIGSLLQNLVPSETNKNQVKSNVYIKSKIKLKSKRKPIELLSDKQSILIENKTYKYSAELIDKLRKE